MTIRFAVVFKTYAWDDFVERQARRVEDVTGAGDFFVSIDETNGVVGPVAFPNVTRFTNCDLIRSGLADRFEKGSLLWWNPDYAHYQFLAEHDHYDYYVFIEYDALIQESIAELVARVARERVDFVALPFRMPVEKWFWAHTHRETYPIEEIRGSLNCITVFSRRALLKMRQRRMEMSTDPRVRYWPMSEAFLLTEIERAGYVHRSLEEFGTIGAYDWFPPTLEEDLPHHAGSTFLHPVLDPRRYIGTILKSNPPLSSFLLPWSEMHRRLKRVHSERYLHLLPGEFRRRSRGALETRLGKLKSRMRNSASPEKIVSVSGVGGLSRAAGFGRVWLRLARLLNLPDRSPIRVKSELGAPKAT